MENEATVTPNGLTIREMGGREVTLTLFKFNGLEYVSVRELADGYHYAELTGDEGDVVLMETWGT